MLNSATVQEKFILLEPWFKKIIEVVKKDLKNHHLKKSLKFCKEQFQTQNPNKVTVEQLCSVYRKLIDGEKGDEYGEFICNRWLLKNSEIYYFFEKEMIQINENFEEIKELSTERSSELIEKSVTAFGAQKTYIFSVINSVVFPEEVYAALRKRSEAEIVINDADEEVDQSNVQKSYEQKIDRLTDRYEKKLLGFQKKYDRDIEMLKKQIVNLQKKVLQTA